MTGARYMKYQNDLLVQPAGDPTFLNSEYPNQPLLALIKESGQSIVLMQDNFLDEKWGKGWAWNDYPYYYMAEKSAMPMYANIAKFYDVDDSTTSTIGSNRQSSYTSFPTLFSKPAFWGQQKFSIPKEIITDRLQLKSTQPKTYFEVKKNMDENIFNISMGYEKMKMQEIPFSTSNNTQILLLNDTLNKTVVSSTQYFSGDEKLNFKAQASKIFTQPTDSLLKPMMHRSDNFFAEQTLLMVSNELLGYMSSELIIDSLLKGELKNIPQKPRWVDGSGLSRYNLFTPQDFVWLLSKAKSEVSWERIKSMLATGGEGTLRSFYKDEAGFIYAKTGTLSNNCALSGYLITKKNKVLVFSILANNYQTSATPVRRAVEKFLKGLREKY